ncbi:hypothetical protein [Campylobacter geochelonis]|uniref:Ribosomal RNA small subunit methyltransferase E n=1 Tax=Campylobacter geochelonis TaxID=1780362 RepID=A0A128EC43_9BACT|nr:hypothetical protein [Campylobacter geochelonis]QKF70559.1 putative membrane protein [Campylobacter geochelonis]CZE46037.1 Ribosomal RNA small subunit methyltransferase E [Campylobacter geochelonis]CZE50399.1 Ribosomal RNA small subunit methyltransferase E [Campylobacter geochelonis]
MQELYEMSLSLHKFFVWVVFGLSVLHLVLSQVGSGMGYVKRIRLLLPLYYACLAAVLITGAVILPVLKFELSYSVIIMIIAFIAMIGIGAMGYKKLKRAYFRQEIPEYKKKIRVLIGINLALILVASFV